MTLTTGTRVQYRDRSNRKRTGTIDASVIHPDGETIYRVNDHWFAREGLRAV